MVDGLRARRHEAHGRQRLCEARSAEVGTNTFVGDIVGALRRDLYQGEFDASIGPLRFLTPAVLGEQAPGVSKRAFRGDESAALSAGRGGHSSELSGTRHR